MENTEFYTTPSGDVMIKPVDEPAKMLKDEAVSIVGGMARFIELCESGRIRYSKSTSAQNSRWKCNAWDVISHAEIPYLEKSYQKLQKS